MSKADLVYSPSLYKLKQLDQKQLHYWIAVVEESSLVFSSFACLLSLSSLDSARTGWGASSERLLKVIVPESVPTLCGLSLLLLLDKTEISLEARSETDRLCLSSELKDSLSE